MAIFSNLGCRVRHARSTTSRRRPATASRCRSCSSSATASASSAALTLDARRATPEGALAARSRKRGFGLRFALDAAPRALDARRPPLRASRPRATRSSASCASPRPTTSSCVVTATRTRCSARSTRSPSSPDPGRGVTVIKTGADDAVVGFGVGRAKDKDVAHRRDRRRQGAARRARRRYARHRARRQGPRADAQDEDRARRRRRAADAAAAADAERTWSELSMAKHRPYTSERHHGPRGPRAGPQAARHVHRRHRQQRATTTCSGRSSTTRSTR